MNKIKDIFKDLWGKIITILTAVVLFFTFVDFFIKWKMWIFIFSLLLSLFIFIWSHIFETAVLLWLVILTVYFLINRSKNPKVTKENEKLDLIEKRLSDTIKKQTDLDAKIKSVESKLDNKIFDIERSLVDFEIEEHLKKSQVGALAMMLKKLTMDIKRGWEVDDTLFEIKDYIKNHGMPHFYFTDLNKALGEIPDDFKLLKEEILKLAQEKLYKVK